MAVNFKGVALDVKDSFAFLWCRQLGAVFMPSSRNTHLFSGAVWSLRSALLPGNFVQFRAVRQPTKNCCSWLALDVLPAPQPPSLQNKNKDATFWNEIQFEGVGIAFPNIENSDAGFMWSEELGTIQFAVSALRGFRLSSIPPPFQIVRFLAHWSKSRSDDTLWGYFWASEVRPGSAEDGQLVAQISSIVIFDQARLGRLSTTAAPEVVFFSPKTETELLCVHGADMFSQMSSIRQLTPDCSYLVHAVPCAFDPTDFQESQLATEQFRRKKWRVLVVNKEPEAVTVEEILEKELQDSI